MGAAAPSWGFADGLMEEFSNRLAMGASADTLCGRSRGQSRRKTMGTVGKTADTQQTRERDLQLLYRRDPYSWARAQAEALRRRAAEAIDWKNVTDEIEYLAREAERRLKRHYMTVIQHFLQLQYREGCDTDLIVQWDISVDNARMEIEELLQDSPGLKAERHRLFRKAWELGREKAITVFVHHAVTHIQNVETWRRECKRLRQEWSQLLPQKNPYTRRRVEAKFWLPEPIRLAERPQIREPAVRSSSDTP